MSMTNTPDYIDPVKSTEMMRSLDVTPDDIQLPDKYSKLETILKYFSGKEGNQALIERLLIGKNIPDKLLFVTNYVLLRSDMENKSNRINLITPESVKEMPELGMSKEEVAKALKGYLSNEVEGLKALLTRYEQ